MIKQRLVTLLQSARGSVTFRLTLNYAMLALATSLISLLFVYYQTTHIFESRFARQVVIMAQRISGHYDQNGVATVIREINLELADNVNTDTEMFLLTDMQGKTLAGNIEGNPIFALSAQPGLNHAVMLRGRPVESYLVTRSLPDGSHLVVGQDLRDLHEITNLIKTISLAATFVIALLVLLGAYLFRHTLQRRVEVIRQTATQIGAGQMTRRIPIQRHQDEFALLSNDINTMLDRIEHLMAGVRHVSDAVAHHLRTPLNRILSRLNRLRYSETPKEDLHHHIDVLVSEIEDLVKISEKLMQIGELESGTKRNKFEVMRLDTLAHDVVELYEAVAEERHIVFRYSASGDVSVLGDRDLLAGALTTLVDNAFKYCKDGAHISIDVTQASGTASIAVSDDGPGIPADKQSRMGERFYRLNRDVPGYGLGLTTVIAIARLHDATLELSDAEPGLRATIRFERYIA